MKSCFMRRDPIRNLDLLRAAAVLFVVFAHLFGLGPDWKQKGAFALHRMGLLGVLIFFVHTSLVLMMSLERLMKEYSDAAFSYWRNVAPSFYVRRFFRIYPLAIFVVLGVTLLKIPADPFFPYRRLSMVELAANLALMQNLIKSSDAIGPLWSLPWEVQMYMALPLLFLLTKRGHITSLAAVAAAVIAANTCGIALGIRGVRILEYAPCFISGVLAYMLIRRIRPTLPAWLWPCTLAAMGALLIVPPFSWTEQKIPWGYWAICIVLGVLIPRFEESRPSLLTQTAHKIAQYSYGIYLFHVPAIWLAYDRLRGLGSVASAIMFVVVTATLSVATYHLLEHPLIEFGKRMTTVKTAQRAAQPV